MTTVDPQLPTGRRIYAIGDIHGRADLLDRMAGLIAADLAARPVAAPLTVCLGDYGDRGPDTAGVVRRLLNGPFPTALVTIRGNHDEIFRDLLCGEVDFDYYAMLGGEATLSSYGLVLDDLAWMGPDEMLATLRQHIPADHRAFFDATLLSYQAGDYFFCHAGARPGVPLDQQDPQDLIWIREEFLESSYDFGKIVVHGHTPTLWPNVRVNGINVDTKAFASGVLTAVVLEGRGQRFLQTGR